MGGVSGCSSTFHVMRKLISLRKCAFCENLVRSMGQRTCHTCHAEAMRKHRATHKLSGEALKRAKCRWKLNVYVKRGSIKKQPCEVCGAAQTLEAHHEDYDKPLEVKWLCRKHHLALIGAIPRKEQMAS